jgi:hypothetical protein
MDERLIGKWVKITLTNDKEWIGQIEEWDEDALFISNGNAFGKPGHKGAECTNGEIKDIAETDLREFQVS